jgi:N6-adenosine-specific RNA methylase IME4
VKPESQTFDLVQAGAQWTCGAVDDDSSLRQLALPCGRSVERAEQAPVVLLADPPWLFRDSLPGTKRGASSHYPCMPIEDLCALHLPPLGANAVLFLWRVSAMQEEALRLARAWGFVVKSELVWVKTTRSGKTAFGMGHYTRAAHEVCLICTRGSALPDNRSVRSVLEAPMDRHSAKPAAFYEIIEQMYPRSERFELFARTRRPGWTQYGNELAGQAASVGWGLFADVIENADLPIG